MEMEVISISKTNLSEIQEVIFFKTEKPVWKSLKSFGLDRVVQMYRIKKN